MIIWWPDCLCDTPLTLATLQFTTNFGWHPSLRYLSQSKLFRNLFLMYLHSCEGCFYSKFLVTFCSHIIQLQSHCRQVQESRNLYSATPIVFSQRIVGEIDVDLGGQLKKCVVSCGVSINRLYSSSMLGSILRISTNLYEFRIFKKPDLS